MRKSKLLMLGKEATESKDCGFREEAATHGDGSQYTDGRRVGTFQTVVWPKEKAWRADHCDVSPGFRPNANSYSNSNSHSNNVGG